MKLISCKFCRGSGYQSACTHGGCRQPIRKCEEQHHSIATFACRGGKTAPGCNMVGVVSLDASDGHFKDDPMHARNAPLRTTILEALAHNEILAAERVGNCWFTHAQAARAIQAIFNR